MLNDFSMIEHHVEYHPVRSIMDGLESHLMTEIQDLLSEKKNINTLAVDTFFSYFASFGFGNIQPKE